ncbi:MAG: hypothetical protein HKM06_06960 [Spirochaetales bacterium]|nr:hypothetical protein [Spirochaetales bacterium]
MNTSDVYFKKAKEALRRSEGASQDRAIADVRDTLFHFLGELPDNMKYDIFNFYLERWFENGNGDLYALAEAPMNLIDFMTGQVLDSEVEFSDAEWEMIRDGINANADSMDLRLLNQLMTILVDKKRY